MFKEYYYQIGNRPRVVLTTIEYTNFQKTDTFSNRLESSLFTLPKKPKSPGKQCKTVRNRVSLRGNFGDIEFAFYESWVIAFKANNNHGMMDAIKHAMNDEFSRHQIAESGF